MRTKKFTRHDQLNQEMVGMMVRITPESCEAECRGRMFKIVEVREDPDRYPIAIKKNDSDDDITPLSFEEFEIVIEKSESPSVGEEVDASYSEVKTTTVIDPKKMNEGSFYKIRLAPTYADIVIIGGEKFEAKKVCGQITLTPFNKEIDEHDEPTAMLADDLIDLPF